MLVLDTSVWINRIRDVDGASVREANKRIDFEHVVLGDIVLLELLKGARSEDHAARLEHEMRQFPIVAMLDDEIAVQAARNYRLLRSRGITIRKTADLIIGTFCIERGHHLLHDDRDFDPMVAHLGLRVI